MQEKIRCKWCNLKNPLYVKYHDEEWCKPNFNEKYLEIYRRNMVHFITI